MNQRNKPDEAKRSDNGSDHGTSAGPADADESGYRRDDYWRAQQEGIAPGGEAGAQALREREAVRSGGASDTSGPDDPELHEESEDRSTAPDDAGNG